MGLKSKIIAGLAIVGCCGILAGMTGTITSIILSNKHQEKAFALLKSEETCRLTTEFNAEKSEFEVATERFVSGDIDQTEYSLAKVEYQVAEKSYEDDLRNLESREHLHALMKSVPKDEECAKEYEKSQKLGNAVAGCVSAGLVGLVATTPIMVDGVVSHKAYRRGWIER